MTFDFSQPMTSYEFLAIILAAVASALAILIPLVSFLWKKYIVKPKIDFIPSATIKLYFNRSGSYLYLGGAFECKNAPSTIKQIEVNVKRLKDSSVLGLNWSSFISPVYQYVGNNPVTTNETARSFQIYKDGLVPVFIEFASKDAGVNGLFNTIHTELSNVTSNYSNSDWNKRSEEFEEAKASFVQTEKYRKHYPVLLQNLFWLKGEYTIEIKAKYNDNEYIKVYKIEISDDEAQKIQNNVELSMLLSLYDRFSLNSPPIYVLHKDFIEVN